MLPLIPSLKALLCFDYCARHGSVSKAAQDLNLTQSAVSRQIKTLEDYVATPLFYRQKQRLLITPQGQDYLEAIRPHLSGLEEATLKLRTAQVEIGALTIAAPPTFTTRILIPMMGAFQQAHPDIPLNFIARIGPPDFKADGVDIAIAYGQGAWPDLYSLPLTAENVIPVCHPDLAAQLPDHPSARDLLGQALLHIHSRPTAWRDWFHHHDTTHPNPQQGPHFEHFTMALQAALAGLGIALLPDFAAQDEIQRGRLIALSPASIDTASLYWLTCPTVRSEVHKIKTVMTWFHDHRQDLPYYSTP